MKTITIANTSGGDHRNFRSIPALTKFIALHNPPLGGWIAKSLGNLNAEEFDAINNGARDEMHDLYSTISGGYRSLKAADWQRVADKCFNRCGTDPSYQF
jgi:hypothetical protein